MASVGGITMYSVKGAPDLPGETVTELERPTVDGVAFRLDGLKAKQFQIRSKIDVTSAANVLAAMEAMKALQGTLITYIDDYGNTYENFVVRGVEFMEPKRVAVASGGIQSIGTAQYMLEATWTLHYPYAAG